MAKNIFYGFYNSRNRFWKIIRMNIHFTGIKNVGFETRSYAQKYEDEEDDNKNFNEIEDEYFLNVQLSDDKDGNDLTEFRDHVRKTGLKNFSHPYNPNMLSLQISKDVLERGYSKNIDYQVYINDADKELEVNDNNLQMFSYLARLLNKISNLPNQKLIAEREYLSDDAAESVILGENLKETYGDAYNYEIERIHSPNIVKYGARKMSSLITEIMANYFDGEKK